MEVAWVGRSSRDQERGGHETANRRTIRSVDTRGEGGGGRRCMLRERRGEKEEPGLCRRLGGIDLDSKLEASSSVFRRNLLPSNQNILFFVLFLLHKQGELPIHSSFLPSIDLLLFDAKNCLQSSRPISPSESKAQHTAFLHLSSPLPSF